MPAAYLKAPAHTPLPPGSLPMIRPCDRLIAYPSGIDAARDAHRARRRKTEVYRCPQCSQYHVGRPWQRVAD